MTSVPSTGTDGTHRRLVRRSLRRLRTDRIDLYQLHRPSDVVPQEETLGALGELVDAGKVRWIGSSTFPAWMVMEALAMARERNLPAFVSEQPPYNLLDRRIENELLPMCERYGLAVAAVVTARRRGPQRSLRLRDTMPATPAAARIRQTRGSAHRSRPPRRGPRWASWPASAG